MRTLKGHSSAVNCAIYSSDGRYILSASKDKTIREWDRETGECLHIYRGHSAAVRSVTYSADGRWILSASKDNSIREWDRITSECLRIIAENEAGSTDTKNPITPSTSDEVIKTLITADNTTEEYIEKLYDYIVERLLRNNPSLDQTPIRSAFEFAERAYNSQIRESGESYIVHSLEVARIVAEMNLDAESVTTTFLHGVIENTAYTYDDISDLFGATVTDLVEGVAKFPPTRLAPQNAQQAENMRKMLIAVARDIRVVLIKIAERLHSMRVGEQYGEQNLRKISLETMEIYAPLAHRLGLADIKTELENLSLKHLDPVAYTEVVKMIHDMDEKQPDFLAQVADIIDKRLKKEGIDATIECRTKGIYSIYRKMHTDNCTMHEIYDLYRVRILVSTKTDCYSCLGIIHDSFNPTLGRFKDYIAVPKANSYQSLHSIVIGVKGIPFAVQIRTSEMHQTAEHGIAAQWINNESGRKKADDHEWLRQISEFLNKDDSEGFINAVRTDLFAYEVFVFTPKGDVISLPAGAVGIDFAYAIHSEIGNHMIAVTINGKQADLYDNLQSGDIVEVITSLTGTPNRDWFKMVRTSNARKRIRKWLKNERKEENIAVGKSIFEKELNSASIPFNAVMQNEVLPSVLQRLKINNIEDIYNAIGHGGFHVSYVLRAISDELIKVTKKANTMLTRFYRELEGMHYENAFGIFTEFEKYDNERYSRFADDLEFIFASHESLEQNKKHWTSYKNSIDYKTMLWCLLTRGLRSKKEESTINLEGLSQNENTPKSLPSSKKTRGEESSQTAGKNLEINVAMLLRQLFVDIEGDEHERILVELRRQLSGSQGGCDLRLLFTYNDKDKVPCWCAIECKDYNVKKIPFNEITGKLEDLRLKGQTVHHWILISPNGQVDNLSDSALRTWEEENRYDPIQKIHFWTKDSDVDELFGLIPELFDHYYPEDRRINPAAWDNDERGRIAKKWRDKLAPAIPMPKAWRDYLKDSRWLLTSSEAQSFDDYEDLYERRVQIRCLDESGNPLNTSAEQYVIDWVNRSESPYLFVLSEFGEGKTYLTYSLAKRLSKSFLESPSKSIIPLRMTLKDLPANIDAQDFLRSRLEAFGANPKEWNDIRNKYRILVILDGFDEMSTGMNTEPIAKNIRRLWECVNLLKIKGIKIIITSRSPAFKNVKPYLIERINPCEIISLAPIDLKERINHLSSYASEHGLQERFEQLKTTYNLLGLASKALFLDMMKITMQGEIKEADNVSIYEHYVKTVLNRKVEIQFDRDNDTVNITDTLARVEEFLEDFAIVSFGQELGISFDKLTQEIVKYKDDPIAEYLWRGLTTSTQEDNEDAKKRLVNRSLLKEIKDGQYTFCHRSMQEYFVARGICRWLEHSQSEAENYLSKVDLTIETIEFSGKILSKLYGIRKDRAKNSLVSMIEKTRGVVSDSKKPILLGKTSLNLYYATWKTLPDMSLSDLALDNAVLPEADFTGRNISKTTLRYANLDNANFTNADLTDCDLTGVRFDETKTVYAMRFFSEDKSYLYALYSDGKVRKWDIYNNKHTEVDTFDIHSSANMDITDYGLLFFQKEKIIFTHRSEEGIKENGGVSFDENTIVSDIYDNHILLVRHNKIFFYNVKEHLPIIEKLSAPENTKGVILDESTFLLYNDAVGLQIILPSSEDASIIHFDKELKRAAITEMTAFAIAPHSSEKSKCLICIGTKQTELSLYSFDRTTREADGDVCSLEKIASYQPGKYIKNICFLYSGMIAYTSTDGIIHVLSVDEYNELHEMASWRLAVKCRGATIDGVKQKEQHEKLKTYRDFGSE